MKLGIRLISAVSVNGAIGKNNDLLWRIPEDLKHLSNVKKQRIVKICPHRYLKEYGISIWVDGSFEIIGDVMSFVSQYDLEKIPFYTRVHPIRKCIYKEAEACIQMKKDSIEVI